jgi:asparaginyl-tRNA synthetase
MYGNTPFWVVGIPRTIEPFPYVVDAADPRLTRTADLIASRGYGELLGIAEKIQDLAMLDERLAEKGKAGDPRYEWLRDLRKYGCVPHGGFGMGLERLMRWLLGTQHVRDAIPFPRTFGRRIQP